MKNFWNRVIGLNGISGRKNGAVKNRSLQMEQLEERQLLAVTAGIPAPAVIDVAELTVADAGEAVSLLLGESIEANGVSNSGSGNNGQRTFKTNSGGDLDKYTSGTIAFNIKIDGAIDTSKAATLTLRVYDVDYDGSGYSGPPERDTVTVNGKRLSGYLTGANDSWSTCTFNIDPNILRENNTIVIDIDTLSGGWAVECDWGEIKCSVVTPDISVETITISCNNPSINPDWGAVVGEKVKLVATIQENTEDHNLNDYSLKNMVWKIEKIDANGNFKTVKTVTVNANRWVKDQLSEDQWKIEYTGWLPEKGDHGSYKITCTLNYKVNGANWFANLFSKTFSSSQTLDDAKVDVTEYAVAWAKPKWDENGSLVREFDDDISTLSYEHIEDVVVSRRWYEKVYLSSSFSSKSDSEKQRSLELVMGLTLDSMTYYVPSDSCYLVFGAAGKNNKINTKNDLLASDSYVLSTPDGGKGCYEITFEYPNSKTILTQSEFLLKQNDFDNWQEGHRATIGNPKYDISQPESVKNQKWIQTGYFVEKEFNTASGLDAFGISPMDSINRPVLLFSGTDFHPEATGGFLADIITDANPDGIGYDQYSEKRVEMESWVASQSKKVDIYGYSLGAAQSQWFVANYHGSVGKVELYNAPGISRKAVDYYNSRSHSVESISYHIAIGDLVSMAGEAYLTDGTVYLYTNSNRNYNCFDYHLAPMVTENTFAFSRYEEGELKGNLKYKKSVTLKDRISSEAFSSYWFNYNSEIYYDFFINHRIPGTLYSIGIPNVLVRGTTEYLRSHGEIRDTLMWLDNVIQSGSKAKEYLEKTIVSKGLVSKVYAIQFIKYGTETVFNFGGLVGSGVNTLVFVTTPVDLSLSNGWILRNINDNLYRGILSGYQGHPTAIVQTPDGIPLTAFISYLGYGLNDITVDTDLYWRQNGKNLQIDDTSIWLTRGELSFVSTDGKAPTDVYKDTDYILSGDVSAVFGSDRLFLSQNMASLKISSIKGMSSGYTSPTSSAWNISDIELYYDGRLIAGLDTGSHTFTATKKGKQLSGNVDLTLTVYDYKLNSDGTDYELVKSERTFGNSTITFISGLKDDIIKISNNGGEDSLLFQYAEGKSPTLKIGSTVYSYNSSMNEWYTTAAKPVVPQQPDEELTPNALPTGFSGVIEVNASGYEVSVVMSQSMLDAYSDVSLYLDTDDSGFDGDYITTVAKTEMVLENGFYTYSFDLSGTGVDAGTYYLYVHGDFEDEEQSVYSNAFSLTLTQPLQALALSGTTYEFADANVGSVNLDDAKQVTVTNVGDAAVTFAIAATDDSDYQDFLFTGLLPDGSELTSPIVSLSPGDSLLLDIYFVPQTVGDKGLVINLLSDTDGSELGTISFTGNALEMLPTDLETSAADAEISALSVSVGDPLEISCNVSNISPNTAANSAVSFYVSQNADDITSGTKIGVIEISEWLLSGESETVTLSLESFPQIAAGNYYIGWVVECDNDSDLTNNIAVLAQPLEVLAVQNDSFSVVSETTEDTNGNGFYDLLTICSTVKVENSGDYTVYYSLEDSSGTVIASGYTEQSLINGDNIVDFSFDGNDIFRSGTDGPFVLSVGIFGDEYSYTEENAYSTAEFAYSEFEGGQAVFTGVYSDSGIDTDSDGKFNALTINVGVMVNSAGTYEVAGTLVDTDGDFVGFATVTMEAQPGNHLFELNFDAADIISSSTGGLFTLTELRIEDVSQDAVLNVVNDVYTTENAYDIADFDTGGVVFTGDNAVIPQDVNGNQLYDNLIFRIGVSVDNPGTYYLNGIITDCDANTMMVLNRTCELTTADSYIDVVIEGVEISDNDFNGPYEISGLQFTNTDGDVIAYEDTFTSEPYLSSQFEHQTLSIGEEISDSLDESGNYLNVVFKATSENGGYFNANARIVDLDGNEICWATTNPYLNAGEETEVTLQFSYQDIMDHGVSGPFFVKDFSLYNEYGSNTYDSIFILDFHETAAYSIVLNVPVFNLADFDYGAFMIDASADDNYTATLLGQEKDGSWTELQSWDYIGAKAKATITGQDKVAENLTISAEAMSLLGEIVFDGGLTSSRDTVTVLGSGKDDTFTLGSENVQVEVPVITENPYAKQIEAAREKFGETSPIYLRIKATLDKNFEAISKVTVSKKVLNNFINLEGGASVTTLGTKKIAVDASDGDDTIVVGSLLSEYTLSGGEGSDTLDFSAMPKVVINLDATYKQAAVPGQVGTVRLNKDIENVVGTAGSDTIYGLETGSTITGNGGTDVVVLSGGTNNVTLSGKGQVVTARGTGVYNVQIENGDYALVNAAAVLKGSTVNVAAVGTGITVNAGLSDLNAEIAGSNATVNATAARSVNAALVGNYAHVYTGQGADAVSVIGNNAVVKTGLGNDRVILAGSSSYVYAGAGDDLIILADGENSVSTKNYIYAESGNDAVYAAMSSGDNFFYAAAGNDIIVGGAGNDRIYGIAGNNILAGLDGADRLYGGTGRDILLGSRSSNLADLEGKSIDEVSSLLTSLYASWVVDQDMEATLDILGSESLADQEKDWLYRTGGKQNLFFANLLDDGDFEDALIRKPFFDTLIDG